MSIKSVVVAVGAKRHAINYIHREYKMCTFCVPFNAKTRARLSQWNERRPPAPYGTFDVVHENLKQFKVRIMLNEATKTALAHVNIANANTVSR